MTEKAVYIQWCDAISNQEPWLSKEEAYEWAENNNWINEQVAFVLKETDKYILLAGERNTYMSESQYGHIIKIPTTWILKMIELKIPKQQ